MRSNPVSLVPVSRHELCVCSTTVARATFHSKKPRAQPHSLCNYQHISCVTALNQIGGATVHTRAGALCSNAHRGATVHRPSGAVFSQSRMRLSTLECHALNLNRACRITSFVHVLDQSRWFDCQLGSSMNTLRHTRLFECQNKSSINPLDHTGDATVTTEVAAVHWRNTPTGSCTHPRKSWSSILEHCLWCGCHFVRPPRR